MNIWLLGDLHFGVHVNSLQWLDIQKKFFYEYFIPHIKANMKDGDVLIQAGDIFENRHFLNINIFNQVRDIFKDVADVIPIEIILGNHDVYYIDKNDVNSVATFEDWSPNIKVYTEPQLKTYNGSKFLMLPWITDIKVLTKTLKDNVDNADYVVAHMDIQGMTYDNSRKITAGVPMSVLKSYKAIYSGHIHWAQSSGNLTYLGTPYHLNRGDIGNDKGFYQLPTDSMELEFIPNTISPEYKRIDVYDFMEMNLDEVKEFSDGHFIDISWETNLAKKVSFKSILEVFEENGIKTMKTEFPPYTQDILPVKDIKVSEKFDMKDLAGSYLDYKGYKKREVADTLKYMDTLLKKYDDVMSLKIK